LDFDNPAVSIDEDVIHPLLPSDSSVGQEDFVLVDVDAGVLQQRFHMAPNRGTRALRDQAEELPADQRFTPLLEESAVRIVDERERRIGQIAADELGLRLDDVPITFLALAQALLGTPTSRSV
jgi:hypothetical protein